MRITKKISTLVLKSLVTVMLITFAFTSCKKDHDVTTPPITSPSSSVEGSYTGKYGFGNDAPDTDQKYNIKSGGVFQEIGINSGTVVGQGTWKLNGNTLTATYTIVWEPFSTYSVNATYDPATKKLVGTWGWDNSVTDGGKIDMKKQ